MDGINPARVMDGVLPVIDAGTHLRREDGKISTEWHDILVKKGIWRDDSHDDDRTPEERANAAQAKESEAARQARLDRRDEEDEEEQPGEDDEFCQDETEREILARLREIRMRDLKDFSGKAHFGDVIQISRPEWTAQINNAGEGIFVLVHLYADGILECDLMDQCLRVLARKVLPAAEDRAHPRPGRQRGLPRLALPTLLLYSNGAKIKEWVTARPFGGQNMTADGDVDGHDIKF
ncbi:hypothetical protein PAPYR_2155 [Paratrimastix pyriformis]|uniref:Phosducin domain-containing protein n=1 Tax=Paratrimastix pyriformis TaxID=342808 RepID=A0ABQ8UQY2_9EUKA|nr:hypothetical protein PAPYR_2155 [Paratrimastix pyriformis]